MARIFVVVVLGLLLALVWFWYIKSPPDESWESKAGVEMAAWMGTPFWFLLLVSAIVEG